MIYLLQVLFPYLALFYIVDCFILIKKFHLAAISPFGKNFTLKKSGLRFLGFSPFCRFLLLPNLPFFLTHKGVYLWNEKKFTDTDLYEERKFSFIPYKEMKNLNKSPLAPLEDAELLSYLTRKISSQNEQQPFLSCAQEIQPTGKRLHNTFFQLDILQAILFIHTFTLLPLALYTNIPVRIHLILYTMLCCYVAVLALSVYGQRKICRRRHNVSLLLTLLFSPVSALHARHMIMKYMIYDVDWIKALSHILPNEAFAPLLVRELKRIHFSKEQCNDPALVAALQEKEKVYLPLLKKVGLGKNSLLYFVSQKDQTASQYCPFCETGFQVDISHCPDCHIQLFPSEKASQVGYCSRTA